MQYGVRVQKSVFKVNLTARELHILWAALERVSLPEEDSLLAAEIKPGSWREFGNVPNLDVPLVVSM